ncbi:MAG: hypothetical protein LBH25_11655 [Fibromonadaceae bacterium]|jgi:hypothetical protein|nr:hypothetical protein [Fibromonadaceae bacterium]
MKKSLFAAFVASLLQAGLLGCDYCDELPVLERFYINNSGVTVKLIEKYTIKIYPDSNYLHISEQEIKNNDTLCNYYLESKNCSAPNWDAVLGYEDDEYIPVYFRIEFFSEPKVCLVFDGDVKLEKDIRYWENYTFIKKENAKRFYSYTITTQHREMAREEDCQSSTYE